MVRYFRAAVILLSCLVCIACTTLGQPDSAATLQQGEAFFIIGIAPEKVRVFVVDGTLANGSFARSAQSRVTPLSAVLMDVPHDGFVVGRARGGTTLALHRVFDESGFPTIGFGPCAGAQKEMTFTPAAGTVVYLANVTFNRQGNGITPAYSDDLAAARAFMKTHYPNLANKIQRGEYRLVEASEQCPPNLYGENGAPDVHHWG